jgi:hypothetical protein
MVVAPTRFRTIGTPVAPHTTIDNFPVAPMKNDHSFELDAIALFEAIILIDVLTSGLSHASIV